MKRITRQRIAIITAESAPLFEIAINNKFDELAEYKPELVIEPPPAYRAYMRYKYDEYLPESLADQFHLKGINYKCEACSYCKIQLKQDGTPDKRAKKAFCTHHKRGTIASMDACDIFYFELLNHTGQFKNDSIELTEPQAQLKEAAATTTTAKA